MPEVTFYKNNDFSKAEATYKGVVAIKSGLSGIDSIKINTNPAYIVVYTRENFEGDYLELSESISDLKKTPRGSDSGDDWKNQISSFVMYSSKPSFWNSSTPNQNLPVSAEQVLFAIDTNFCEYNKIFNGTTSESDLNEVFYSNGDKNFIETLDMNNNIESLKTGSSAWLVIYDGVDFKGNQLHVNPNSIFSDLNSISRGENGDWKNQIQSFQLFNKRPAWDLEFDLDAFKEMFPVRQEFSDYLSYRTQDADYHVFYPQLSYLEDGSLLISVKIDYVVDVLSSNDHVYVNLNYSEDGDLIATDYSYDAGSAFQISSTTVKVVDTAAEVLGAVGALETAGISEEAAQSFVEAFDTAVKVFNAVSNVVYKFMENDDGRFYLVPVIAHVIAKTSMCLSINK